jgi:hypothetical protein
MWLKDGNCFGEQTWQKAHDSVIEFNKNSQSYNCQEYTAKYRDWRLPHAKELNNIVSTKGLDNTNWLNRQGFSNIQLEHYWSSPATLNGIVCINGGRVYYSCEEGCQCYVWLVRGVE